MTIANSKTWISLFIGLACAAAVAAQEPADLRFTEELVDFGCVGVDFKIYHNFALVNHGKEIIKIDTVTPHCDCTRVRFTDSVVGPGDTAWFRMIFDTKDFYGPMEKDIRVHSSDSKSPKAYSYYRANIGQWLYKVEPKPVSMLLLPSQKTKTGSLLNHALDKITLTNVDIVDDICQVNIVSAEASKGEALEYEVVPNDNLGPGTHATNFTLTIDLHQDLDPLRITIPVKIVNY